MHRATSNLTVVLNESKSAHSNSDEAEEEGAPPLDLRRLKSGSASGSNPSSRESTPRPSPLHSPAQSPRRGGGGSADVDDIGDAILKLQVMQARLHVAHIACMRGFGSSCTEQGSWGEAALRSMQFRT